MILVTGSTGLVGSHLLYKLVKKNEKVRAIYRSIDKLNLVKNIFSNFTEDYEKLFSAIEWVEADLLDIPSLALAFKDVDYVYHCAAFVSFQPHDFHELRRANIEGTANVVNLCISNSIKKLCFVSSIATLGKETNNKPITEQSIWNPEIDHSVYAITKYGAEMEVWRGTQEGVEAVIVNPGVILGAGFWHHGSGSLFKKAKKGIQRFTSGSIALVDVEDVVNIMIILLKSDIKNERFILVAENWSYQKFLIALAKTVNGTVPKKMVSKTFLNIIWKLDWLKYILTRKPRKMTKQVARTLSTKRNYSSSKIKNAVAYNFKDINLSITEIGKAYLKDKQR